VAEEPGETQDSDGKMISFRAFEDEQELLRTAEMVSGKDRSYLLRELVKRFLPVLAVELGHQYEGELKRARATLMQETATPPSQAPESAGRGRVSCGNSASKDTPGIPKKKHSRG